VEFKEAMHCYDESIKLNNSNAIAYYNRGTVLYRLGFYESAIKDLKDAVFWECRNSEFQTALKECQYALNLTS